MPWTLMFREQYGEIKKQNQTSKASLDIALVWFKQTQNVFWNDTVSGERTILLGI